MTIRSMTDARQDFTALANQVMFNRERVCISKNNKPVFALVPIEDLQALEALEDRIDLDEALKALKEPGSVSLKAFKKKLGL